MRVLFLVVHMVKGSGVSVVVNELTNQLKLNGLDIYIACMETDGFFGRHPIHTVAPTAEAVQALARRLGIRTIVAHTSPFFEVLPALEGEFNCLAWEHGEPSPDFFPDSQFAEGETIRRAREVRKRTYVYPKLTGVIAISDFIRNDIGWPEARVIYNGADHGHDFGPKRRQDFSEAKTLKVGLLMRLGPGEDQYKGRDLLFQLQDQLHRRNLDAQFEIMGKGNKDLAREFEEAGIKVHLNASNEERSDFLRQLDVFISLSKWEGFNLPLVEAQYSGTVSLALDAGSHPEVTPLVFQDVDEILGALENYQNNRELLHLHSRLAYDFVKNRFSWAKTALEFQRLLAAEAGVKLALRTDRERLALKALFYLKRHGVQATLRKSVKVALARLKFN